MKEEVESFIEERINKNYSHLRKSEKWKETSDKYGTAYDMLYKQLTIEQQKELEYIVSLKNLLVGYESNFSYQLGKNDTLELLKPQFFL